MNIRSNLWTAIPLTLLAACGGKSGGNPGTPPSALQYSETYPVYMVDATHSALTPSVTGGVTVWGITPALPAGLSLDPLTGEISGTPQASTLRRTYTVRAANSAGSTQYDITFAVEKPERYAYVTSPDDRSITILGLDPDNGAVSRRGFIVTQGWEGHPESFVANTQTPFGYSTTVEGVLTTWAIDPASGWLTEIDTLGLLYGAHALAVSPDGRHVFVTRKGFANVWVYTADPDTGLLSGPGPVIGVAPSPVALALNPAGTLLAVACAGDATSGVGSMLTLHAVDPASGAVSALGSIRLNGAKPASVAFSANQDVVYLGFPELQRLVGIAFDPTSGDMASLGNAFSGAGCGALAIDPQGSRIWAVNETAGTLASFAIQPNGAVSSLGAVASGTTPGALAIDPLGRFLFALDKSTQELGLYDLDSQSRALTQRAAWLSRGHPVHVSFGRGEHALQTTSVELLATAFASSELHVHPVDSNSGLLGAGVSLPTNTGPMSVTIEARQRFAFTGNAQDNSIGRYRIDPATGALTELLPVMPLNGVPIRVIADASGRFLYVAAREVIVPTDGYVFTYAINGSTGELTLLNSVASGIEPNWLGTDPAGEFLYVANTGDGTAGSATIAAFRLDPDSGLPSGLESSPQSSGVWSLGFHPSGKYLYAALRTTNSTRPYKIDRTNGALSPTDAGPEVVQEPMAVAVTPDGRWAYIANRNSGSAGTIGLFAIDQATGGLIPPASPFIDGIAPVDLHIDPSGKFLYTANSGTDTISVFSIQSSDGFLQPLTPTPTGVGPSALALLQHWQ